jgi:hypothetical protein
VVGEGVGVARLLWPPQPMSAAAAASPQTVVAREYGIGPWPPHMAIAASGDLVSALGTPAHELRAPVSEPAADVRDLQVDDPRDLRHQFRPVTRNNTRAASSTCVNAASSGRDWGLSCN